MNSSTPRKEYSLQRVILVFALLASFYVVFGQSEGTSALVSRWNGDEVSRVKTGTSEVSDVEGGNSGVLYDTRDTTPGKAGNAFNLSGSNEYINIGNPENLNFGTGAFSLEAWFRLAPRGRGLPAGNIIRKSNYPVKGPGAGYWLKAGGDDRLLEFYVGETTGIPGEPRGRITTTISPETWYHVVATRDGSGTMKLYVNGELKGTAEAPDANTTSEAPFTLGAWSDRFGVSEFFSGEIEEVSVYNEALDSSEVEYAYLRFQVSYPIPELGNCRNKAECANYCESDDINVLKGCIEFAKKYKLLSDEEIEEIERYLALDLSNGPGGCKDEASCRKYCENIDNIEECLVFVEKFNLATPDELKEMRQIAAAKRAGVPFPGNCKTKQSCLQYCEVPSHTVECVNFAEAAGFISGDEAAQARKFAPLVARGETPGGCTRKAQCEAYCEDTTHIDECMDFAIKYDVLPPDELEIVKKIQPFVKAGKMPGGCKTKAQCEAYCENGDHVTECIDIGLALGIIKPEEVEMIKKSGGRGPGNCRSREACEAFCSDPKNQKECMDFAVRIGLITEEEAQGYQNAGDMNQCFEEADEQIIACFVTNLGADVFEQMKSGRMPHDIAILEKMRKAKACVSQYADQATDVLEDFLEALPAANSCVATEFGPDFIGRLRKGNVPCSQMKGIKEKMNACFAEGTNALFEPCAQKECDQVQSCMADVSKSLADIAKQVDAGTPAKPQKQELPPVLQDKLDSCGINLDPLACVSKSTCKEFFSCLGPSGSETDSASSEETPPELLERMNSCQQELDEIKMRECTDKPTCSEVTACLEAQQSGDTQTTGTTEEKVELPADIQSRLTACQQEENQAKIDACLALSCSEFDACIKTLQQAGGDQGQAEQGSEDPRVGAKIQACQEEKVNACLAMPCSEFFACLNSLGAGGGEGGGSPNPAIEAKVQSCTPQSEGQ